MNRSNDQRIFDSLAEDTEVQHGADGSTPGGIDEFGVTHDHDVARLKKGKPAATRINDRYTLKNELGSGGFATVYRAWDENLRRDVAVKIMRPELLQAEHREDFLKRFEREALLVARLDHNHLAPVYETGLLTHKGQDTAFIVMKYLDGQDLSDVLRSEQLPIHRTLKIINQTLEALAYIHSEGVVHKDLKPSNIFLCRDHLGRDHTYLMDFGIAHDTQDAQGRLTSTGVLTGTFQYMPPEYVLLHQATPSVDVFQMGLIITEALTGVALIHRNTTLPALVARYLRRDPLDLPPELAESPAGMVIERALRLDVEDRYADAGELLRAFSALTADDFPDVSPSFITSATYHAEKLLSDPVVLHQNTPTNTSPNTQQTHAEIPSAIEEEAAEERQTDVVPLVPPPIAATAALPSQSPRKTNGALYVVGVLLALSILGAIGALVMLRPTPTPEGPASVMTTSPAAVTTSPEEVVEPADGPPAKAEHAGDDVEDPATEDFVAEVPPVDVPAAKEPTAEVQPEATTADVTKPAVVKEPAVAEKPVKKKTTRKKPPRKKTTPAKPDEPVEKKPTATLPPD